MKTTEVYNVSTEPKDVYLASSFAGYGQTFVMQPGSMVKITEGMDVSWGEGSMVGGEYSTIYIGAASPVYGAPVGYGNAQAMTYGIALAVPVFAYCLGVWMLRRGLGVRGGLGEGD